MKQKTFELGDRLAADFEQFCRSRMLIEKRVAAVALHHFINLSAEDRERAIIEFERAHDPADDGGRNRERTASSPAVGVSSRRL